MPLVETRSGVILNLMTGFSLPLLVALGMNSLVFSARQHDGSRVVVEARRRT